jgi:hypothetical protein
MLALVLIGAAAAVRFPDVPVFFAAVTYAVADVLLAAPCCFVSLLFCVPAVADDPSTVASPLIIILKVKGSDMKSIRTMKRLDQGHLHPLLQHSRDKHVPVGIRIRIACVAGEHSSKELFEYLKLLLFRTSTNLHGCPTAYESNSWITTSSESLHVCRLIGNKLLTAFTRI